MSIVDRLLGEIAAFNRAGDPNYHPLVPGGASITSLAPGSVVAKTKFLLGLDQDTAKALTGGLESLAGQAFAGADRVGLTPYLPRPLFGTPDQGMQALARQALAGYQGSGGDLADRLRAANEAGAHGHGVEQGFANTLFDPANAVGVLANVARAARLKHLAELLDVGNAAQALPFEAAGKGIAAADRAVGAPGARAVAAVGRQVSPIAQRVLDRLAATTPVIPPQRLRPRTPGLPLAPESTDYNRVARGLGLPAVGKTPLEPSPLVPRTSNLAALARDYGGVVETKRLGLPLVPNQLDVRVAQQEQGLPALTKLVDPANPSPLVPERTPNLLQLAKRAQGPVPQAAPRGQAPLPWRGPETPALPIPTPVEPVGAAMPQFVSDMAGTADRGAVVTATANGPVADLTAVLRDLHRSVYPQGQTDFAIPSLTGVGARDFRTSFLTDHPSGNAAEPYLDYLISRVQQDKQAATRLGRTNPPLLADIRALPANPHPLNDQKRTLQALFGAGPFKDNPTALITPGVKAGAADLARVVPDTGAGITTSTTPAGTLADFTALTAPGGAWGRGSAYLPDAAAFARKLNVPVEQAQAWLDDLVRQGAAGPVDATGQLAWRRGGAALPDAVVQKAAILENSPAPIAETATASLSPRIQPTPAQASADLFTDAADVAPTPGAALDPATAAQLRVDRARATIDALKQNRALPFWQSKMDQAQRDLKGAGIQLSAAKKAAQAAGGDIAAGGGGGGGLGLLPYPGGLTGPVGRGIVPLAGAGVGGAAGYLTGDTPEDRKANALKGAAIGAGVGLGAEFSPEIARAAQHLAQAVGPRLTGTLAHPDMHALGVIAGARAQAAAAGQPGVRGLAVFGAFWRQWGNQIVNTLKQFPQDALTRLVTLAGAAERDFPGTAARIPDWQLRLARARALGVPVANPVNDWLHVLGHSDLIPLQGDIVGAEGARQALAPNGQQFGPVGRAVSGGLMSAWTGNPYAIAYGAARGYAAPFVDAYIGLLNGAQHDALRFAPLETALDRDVPALADGFLARLRSQGADTAALDGLGGRFSAADVDAIAPGQGQTWADATEFLIRANGDRIAFLAGDFRDKLAPGYTGKVTTLDKVVGTVEKGAGFLAPFIRWQMRYTPVLAELAARNPVATMLTLRAMAATAGAGGKVSISTETPALGQYARLRLGGQPGTVSANPFGAVTPYNPASLSAAPDLPVDATGYQRLTNLAGKVGIRPHPLIQDAAFVLGQDYKDAGSLSRTAGLEGLADLVAPSGPGMQDALNAARGVVEPALAKVGVPTTGPASNNDQVVRRYAELVFERTHKTLQDPANADYLLRLTDPADPLMQQAQREVRFAAAAGNATGLVSPIAVTGSSTTAQTARAATAAVPFSDARIAAAVPALAAAMTQANDAYTARTPVAGVYQGTKPYQRTGILADQFAQTPDQRYMQRVAPKSYTQQKNLQALNLWMFDNRGLLKSNPAEYKRQYDKKAKSLGLQ